MPLDQPFFVVATTSGYWEMTLQEMVVTANPAGLFEPLTLVSDAYGSSVTLAAPGYDSSLGVLGISVIAQGQCQQATGATLSITGLPPDAGPYHVIYLGNGTPSAAQSVTGAALPSAYAYNLPVGVDLSIAVTHPTCQQAPYPVAMNSLTYTGKVRVFPGGAASYALVFLQ